MANNVRMYRHLDPRDLSLEDLAKLAGMPITTLSPIELQKRDGRLKTQRKLVEALGIEGDLLFPDSPVWRLRKEARSA